MCGAGKSELCEEPPVFSEQEPEARHGAESVTSLSSLDIPQLPHEAGTIMSFYKLKKLHSRDVQSLAKVTGSGRVRM